MTQASGKTPDKSQNNAPEASPDSNLDEITIDRPRLTPRASVNPEPEGTDSTKPGGGMQTGQSDKAEG